MEKPSAGKMMNVPMSETGTASKRNQRGAPSLQEDEDHHDNQPQSFQQREHDLMDACSHGLGRVERNRS